MVKGTDTTEKAKAAAMVKDTMETATAATVKDTTKTATAAATEAKNNQSSPYN